MRLKVYLITILISVVAGTRWYLMGEGGAFEERETGSILDGFTDNDKSRIKSAESGRILLSQRKAISATDSPEKGVLFYEKETGKVFQVDIANKTESVVSSKVLENFLSTVWAPNKRDVISLFYSPNGNRLSYYDYDAKKAWAYDQSIKSAVFSPDGNSVAYFKTGSEEDGGLNKIFIAQPNGSYTKKILDTRLTDIEMFWPLDSQLSFKTKSSVFMLSKDGALSKFFDAYSETLNVMWSQSGKKVLLSYINPNNGITELWFKNTDFGGEGLLTTGISASDCAWSIDEVNIFCAANKFPGSLETEIRLISTDNGSVKTMGVSAVGSKNLFLSSLEDFLVFTSPLDERLYALKISN